MVRHLPAWFISKIKIYLKLFLRQMILLAERLRRLQRRKKSVTLHEFNEEIYHSPLLNNISSMEFLENAFFFRMTTDSPILPSDFLTPRLQHIQFWGFFKNSFCITDSRTESRCFCNCSKGIKYTPLPSRVLVCVPKQLF